jgi:DNA-binding transcriptional ArsR family regulator
MKTNLYFYRDFSPKNKFIMEIKVQVLEAMKKAGGPLNAGKIVELTSLDRKEVDKAMKVLKDEGMIVSPKRCYWEPK